MFPTAASQDAFEGAFLQYAPPPVRGIPDRLLDARCRPWGPPLAKLTPWRHHLLLGYESPFVTGRPIKPADLILATWLCSPRFRPAGGLTFALYRARWAWWAVRHLETAAASFSQWLEAPFALRPRVPQVVGTASARRPDQHWLADRMRLGQQLGLDPVATLHTPYAVLWLLHAEAVGPGAADQPAFNSARDRALRAHLLRRRHARSATRS